MDDQVHSAEPGRTKLYQEDLRWRGIWSVLAHGRTYKESAARLGVCPATVGNWWTLFTQTGDVVGRPHHVESLLDEYGTIYLLTLLERQPSLRLHECCSRLEEAIDHMQISAPFCFGCGRHIERGFAGSETQSIQVRLHCRVSEFWSHCNVLQELGDSRLSFLRHMAESIDSQGAEQEEVGFHRHSRWLSLLFKLK